MQLGSDYPETRDGEGSEQDKNDNEIERRNMLFVMRMP